MPDILKFKDDLLIHLSKQEKPDEDITWTNLADFILPYGRHDARVICEIVNELFAPKDGNPKLMEAKEINLSVYSFNQVNYDTILKQQPKVRITPEGIEYLQNKNPAVIIPSVTNIYNTHHNDDNRQYTNGSGNQIIDSPNSEGKIEGSFNESKEADKKKGFWDKADITAKFIAVVLSLSLIGGSALKIKSCMQANPKSEAPVLHPKDSTIK